MTSDGQIDALAHIIAGFLVVMPFVPTKLRPRTAQSWSALSDPKFCFHGFQHGAATSSQPTLKGCRMYTTRHEPE